MSDQTVKCSPNSIINYTISLIMILIIHETKPNTDELLLGHHIRRKPSNKPTLVQRLILAWLVTRYIDTLLVQYWSKVGDTGPTMKQHRLCVSWFMGHQSHKGQIDQLKKSCHEKLSWIDGFNELQIKVTSIILPLHQR